MILQARSGGQSRASGSRPQPHPHGLEAPVTAHPHHPGFPGPSSEHPLLLGPQRPRVFTQEDGETKTGMQGYACVCVALEAVQGDR